MITPDCWQKVFSQVCHLPEFQKMTLEFYTETTSTSDKVLSSLARHPKGAFLVVADHQLQGRGRRDHSWISSPGHSLLFSFSWGWPYFPEQEFPIALQLGVAVCKAIESMCPDLKGSLWLKWPNDIYLGEQKVGGILVEGKQGDAGWVAVLGIGLNLITFSQKSLQLKGLSGDSRSVSAPDLMYKILSEWAQFRKCTRSPARQREAFLTFAKPLIGSEVTLLMPDGEQKNIIFQGVNNLGQIIGNSLLGQSKAWPECVSMSLAKKNRRRR